MPIDLKHICDNIDIFIKENEAEWGSKSRAYLATLSKVLREEALTHHEADCFRSWMKKEGYGGVDESSSVYHNRKAGWDAAISYMNKRESIKPKKALCDCDDGTDWSSGKAIKCELCGGSGEISILDAAHIEGGKA